MGFPPPSRTSLRAYNRGMRRPRIATLVSAACVLVASCSVRYTVRLSADDVQHFLSQRLPASTSKYLVTATVRSVQVEFIETENGIVVRPDVDVTVGGQRLLQGYAIVAGKIRYDATAGELFVDAAEVVAVAIAGLPDGVRPAAEEVVGKCIEGYLAKQPIYRLKQSDFKQSLAKLVLKSVRAYNGRLEIVVGT